MTTRQSYNVSKVKQLIDLNGTSTNFDVNFSVTCREGKPFQVLVVDQTSLDNNPNLEYKTVTAGQISGNVRNDKNVYQNHFLILRSDEPCVCDVEIEKVELPKMPQQPPMEMPVMRKDTVAKPADEPTNWKKIIIVALLVGVGGYFIYVTFYKSASEELKPVEFAEPTTFTFYSPKSSAPPSASSRSVSAEAPAPVSAFAERLKSLKLSN